MHRKDSHWNSNAEVKSRDSIFARRVVPEIVLGSRPLKDAETPPTRRFTRSIGARVSHSERQPFERAHWRMPRCPPLAAMADVNEFQGQPLDRAHYLLENAQMPPPTSTYDCPKEFLGPCPLEDVNVPPIEYVRLPQMKRCSCASRRRSSLPMV